MSGAQIAIVCGIGLGSGIAVLLLGMLRRAPDLAAALAHLQQPPVETLADDLGRREQFDRWAAGVLVRVPGVKVPHHDLAMIERSVQWYAAKRIAYAIAGALYVLLLGMLLTAAWGLPVLVPVGGVFLGAVLGFFLADPPIRRKAEKRRAQMRRAVSSYVDLVALARLAGAGGASMLESAAEIGRGWAFRRISAALRKGRTSADVPWSALRDLGTTADIPELIDLAVTAQQAGAGGGPVAGQLLATGKQLRSRVQQDAEKAARKAATEIWIPSSMLVIVFLLFLIYPFASRL